MMMVGRRVLVVEVSHALLLLHCLRRSLLGFLLSVPNHILYRLPRCVCQPNHSVTHDIIHTVPPSVSTSALRNHLGCVSLGTGHISITESIEFVVDHKLGMTSFNHRGEK